MGADRKPLASWRLLQLKDLAEINPEQWPENTPPDLELSYVDLAAVDGPGTELKPVLVEFGKAPSRARRKAKVGDILVATVRPYLRGFTRIREESDNLTVSTGYAVVRPKDNYFGEFLYQHVLSNEFIQWLSPRMTGTNYPAVSAADIASYPLFFPPPEIYQRIGDILNRIDDAIDATRALSEQTQRVKSALLDQLILRGLPGRATRLARFRLGELFEERKQKGQQGLSTLSVTMADGLVDRESLDRRVETDLTPEQHLLVCKGDIAYNMMRMWQGVFGLAWQDGIVSPAYVVLKPKPGVDSHYASYLFRHRSTIRKFERFSQGLTGDRLRLYFDQFCQIPVEIPDQESQRKIAEILKSVDDRLDIEERKLTVMSSLKVALSQGLLTGQIPVNITDKEIA